MRPSPVSPRVRPLGSVSRSRVAAACRTLVRSCTLEAGGQHAWKRTHPPPCAGPQGRSSRCSRGDDRPWSHSRDERIHRRGLSEGSAARARTADRRSQRRRRSVQDQCLDRRVDRPRTGRSARGRRRDRTAAAVPVRPGEPREDQHGTDGVHRRPPVARRSDGLGGLPRSSRRRPHRGQWDHRGRSADPLVVGRQQQDLDRPGRRGDPRGECLAEFRARRNARHLLRHRAAAEPPADPADPPW